jgi:hypothetical protein
MCIREVFLFLSGLIFEVCLAVSSGYLSHLKNCLQILEVQHKTGPKNGAEI